MAHSKAFSPEIKCLQINLLIWATAKVKVHSPELISFHTVMNFTWSSRTEEPLQRRVVVRRCSYSTTADSSVEAGSWLGDGGPWFPSGVLHWQGGRLVAQWCWFNKHHLVIFFFFVCVFLQIEHVMTMGLTKKKKRKKVVCVTKRWFHHCAYWLRDSLVCCPHISEGKTLSSAQLKVCLCQYAWCIVSLFFLSLHVRVHRCVFRDTAPAIAVSSHWQPCLLVSGPQSIGSAKGPLSLHGDGSAEPPGQTNQWLGVYLSVFIEVQLGQVLQ